jgi:large subunit ribosomal protein L25
MSLEINAQRREAFGKNAARRIRQEGMVPAILYGPQTDAVALTLDKKDIFSILKSESGENTLFKVTVDSETRDAMIKDYQVDPVSDELIHVDLIQIVMDKAIRVAVPVTLVGEAEGVKTEGGFVDFVSREIEIECLPRDIPEQIQVDISALHLHQSLKVEDITAPEGTAFADDPEMVVVMIQAPTKEEEKVVEEEEEVMAEGEEPEVIKKEKDEEREGKPVGEKKE